MQAQKEPRSPTERQSYREVTPVQLSKPHEEHVGERLWETQEEEFGVQHAPSQGVP